MSISQPKLSVVLAVRNEQANLNRCLKAIQGMTDDLVIVDGSSTDNTREIAKQFTPRVYRVKHQPMFHKNKQIALDKAKHNWVFQLDADEVVTPQLKKEIKAAIKSTQYAGFSLPRKNFFLGRFLTKGGQYPDRVIRLVRKDKSHFPCRSVHEQISVKGQVGELKNDLLHYPYSPISQYFTKFNHYTDLEAKELTKKLKPWSIIEYMILKPIYWFVLTYFRHKGFVDGLPGFIFSLLSALRYPITFIKAMELKWRRK